MIQNTTHALKTVEQAMFALTPFFQSVRWGGIYALVTALLCTPISGHANVRDYVLQPGDGLQLSLPNMFDQTWESIIDITGHVRFPFLGQQPAAGLTLTELYTQMKIAATGVEIKILAGAEKSVNVLSGEELYIQISRYRPITVIGDVAQPGSVEFVPGLTVRALLGHAGGIQLAELADIRAPADSTVRLQSALQTQKWMNAQIFSRDILLNASADETFVSEDNVSRLGAFLSDDETQSMIDEIEIALRERRNQRADLKERIKLTVNRVGNLQKAYANYEEASTLEETRLQQLLVIGDKGLVTADRISDARNSALAASTRLLTVASDIYEAQAELQRLKEDLTQLDDDFHSQALNEKRRFSQQLSEVSAQVDSLRLLLSQHDSSEALGANSQIELLVHRGIGTEEETMPIRPGDLLHPGDVVEVILHMADAS